MLTRQSSGCVVYRITEEGKVEFLLITSSNRGAWVFPKGGVELHLSERESAAKEVLEEAGIHGNVGIELGRYRYMKNDMLHEVTMYAMQYTHDAEVWEEEYKRERRWFKTKKAMEKLDPYLAPYIHDVKMAIEADLAHEARKARDGVVR